MANGEPRVDRAAGHPVRERTCARGHMHGGPTSVYADVRLRMRMQVPAYLRCTGTQCPPLKFSQSQILPILTKPGIEPYLLTSRHVDNDVVGPSGGRLLVGGTASESVK